MASKRLVEQLEEQTPAKKPRSDNPEEQREIANSNEASLPRSTSTERKDEVHDENSPMDLLHSRPLPLELNCEIFKCLKLPIQGKFIWGLGRGIYEMFGQKLIIKSKRVRNPHGNMWNGANTRTTVADDGLNVINQIEDLNVFAEQPFLTSGPHCRMDEFPGTILYYYEVKGKGDLCNIGVSDGTIPDDDDLCIGEYTNSYAFAFPIDSYYGCWLAGERRQLELPEGIRPRRNHCTNNVFGCGLVLDPQDKLCIFFTLNGKLMARKIPISPTVDRLFPAVTVLRESYLEANFGDDPAKPFKYDISNCPGLGLACI